MTKSSEDRLERLRRAGAIVHTEEEGETRIWIGPPQSLPRAPEAEEEKPPEK